MELEVTIRIPTDRATMTIPKRERIWQDGVAGGRVVDSVHAADVGGLRGVDFANGRLSIALKTGEEYTFSLEALTEGKDPVLQLCETIVGHEPAALGGTIDKARSDTERDAFKLAILGVAALEAEFVGAIVQAFGDHPAHF